MLIVRLILTAMLIVFGLPVCLFMATIVFFVALPESLRAIWTAGRRKK